MRARLAAILLGLTLAVPTRADPPRLAVFDFELFDTSLPKEMNGPRRDEHERLMRAGEQLRKELAESGKFELLDISPINAAAHNSNLLACGGCDVRFAQQLGADLYMIGVVQKVSELILIMSIQVRDAHTGHLVAAVNADLRGNSDETWSRATTYLLHHRLLAPNYGAPRPQ